MNSTCARLSLVLVTLHWVQASTRADLLVSDRITNRILRYDDRSGDFLQEVVGPGNPLSASDLMDPAAMAQGIQGDLFVASRGTGSVLRYDLDTGAFLEEFASGINGPSGLLVDTERNELLVSQLGNFDAELILRFDLDSGARLDNPIGAGGGPTGRSDLVMGSDGLLYAASFFDGRVLRYDPATGAPRGSNPQDPTGTFAGPVLISLGSNGLAFDAADNLYVVGLFTSNVVQYDTDGQLVRELIPALGGGLFFPADLQINQDGDLLVSSLGNDDPDLGLPLGPGYIGKYDLETGQPLDPFFITGGGLEQPSSLLVLADAVGPRADFNGDGVVDGDDFLIWQLAFAVDAQGDADDDGDTDGDDFLIWQIEFGGVAASPTAAAVPEPTACALASVLAALLGGLARGGRRL